VNVPAVAPLPASPRRRGEEQSRSLPCQREAEHSRLLPRQWKTERSGSLARQWEAGRSRSLPRIAGEGWGGGSPTAASTRSCR